jgi:acyl-homoserine lactone acylase PvdQ
VYPGGQSGNPARAAYTAFIDDWQRGNHYPLRLFGNAQEAIGVLGGAQSIAIQPGGNR